VKQVKVNGRWPLTVPDHCLIWDRPAGWEVERLDAMYERIGPFSVVYYVGAAEGDMPALIAGWGARMVLVEPGTRVWANIRATWEANGLQPPAACFPGFAYDVTRDAGGIDFLWPASSDGPVITDHGFRNFVERPEIPSIRLDDLAERSGVIPTDISIDVEGAEWHVLRGAEELMRAHRPRLWVSIHHMFMAQYGEDATDMHRWVENLGYRGRLLEWHHEMHMMYLPVGAE